MSKSSELMKLVSNDNTLVMPVHKELLCFFSSYYDAALNGNFSEAQKNCFEVALSGYNLKSFTAWLYTGDILSEVDTIEINCFLELYVFADLVDIIALRRETLKQISETEGPKVHYDSVRFILKNTTQNSQLYRWTLAFYITHWQPEHDDDGDPCLFDSDTDPDYLLATFMYKVTRGLAVRGKDVGFIECSCCNHPCEYHEHSSMEEWEASVLMQFFRFRHPANDCAACGQHTNSKMPASLE